MNAVTIYVVNQAISKGIVEAQIDVDSRSPACCVDVLDTPRRKGFRAWWKEGEDYYLDPVKAKMVVLQKLEDHRLVLERAEVKRKKLLEKIMDWQPTKERE